MTEKYFEKFQVINYANTAVVNLTQRATVLNKVQNNPYLFYPYDITGGVRPDQVSDTYYNDQYMSWLVYLSNNIIDPYYQWYLNDEDFNNYLKKKYNVLTTNILKQKVAFFRNNWENGENISVSEYNALTINEKKYWQPVYGLTNIIGYERSKKDWNITTNEVVQYTLNNNQNVYFINNEIVDVYLNGEYSGKGQIAFSNSTIVSIQHTEGITYSSTLNGYLYGNESKSNTLFSSSTLVMNNIPATETKYYSRVYIYDIENEKNEQNKTIRLLSKSYSMQTAKELKNLLK